MSAQTLVPPIEIEKQNKTITGEELFQMGDIGRSELVKGEIVRMSPTGHPHADYEGNFYAALREFVKRNKLGRVFVGEVGIYTHRDPDTVRAADVAFVSKERMSKAKPQGYLDVAPDLVVEILSPDDAWSDLMEKLDEYFSVGVKSVWVADPRKQQVYVYHSATDVKRFNANETLIDNDALPGFSASMADLFLNE
jgi:Uma2 family endonuclease